MEQTYRTHAIAAGILFIIATALLFVGEALYSPPLNAANVLQTADTHRAQIVLGILIEMSCVLAIPLIPVVLYPVLRRVSAVLAIGYVAFRLFEAAIFAGQEVDRLLVLALARAYAEAPIADTGSAELLIRALTSGEAWSGTSGMIYNLVFVTGMLMFNWMLWSSRLVPRWISGWGLITAVIMGVLSVVATIYVVPTWLAASLIAPLAIQEMVLALWFIVKGFNQSALGRLPAAG